MEFSHPYDSCSRGAAAISHAIIIRDDYDVKFARFVLSQMYYRSIALARSRKDLVESIERDPPAFIFTVEYNMNFRYTAVATLIGPGHLCYGIAGILETLVQEIVYLWNLMYSVITVYYQYFHGLKYPILRLGNSFFNDSIISFTPNISSDLTKIFNSSKYLKGS